STRTTSSVSCAPCTRGPRGGRAPSSRRRACRARCARCRSSARRPARTRAAATSWTTRCAAWRPTSRPSRVPRSTTSSSCARARCRGPRAARSSAAARATCSVAATSPSSTRCARPAGARAPTTQGPDHDLTPTRLVRRPRAAARRRRPGGGAGRRRPGGGPHGPRPRVRPGARAPGRPRGRAGRGPGPGGRRGQPDAPGARGAPAQRRRRPRDGGMTTLVDVGAHVPTTRVPIRDLADELGLDHLELGVFERFFGLREVCTAPGDDLADLLVAAARAVPGLAGNEHRVRYVLGARTIATVAPVGVNPLHDAATRLGLDHAVVWTLTQHACASALLAVDVAGRLLASDGDPDALALVLTGEKAFSPGSRLIEGTTIMGEGTAAVLVGADGSARRAGSPVLSYATRTLGEYHQVPL